MFLTLGSQNGNLFQTSLQPNFELQAFLNDLACLGAGAALSPGAAQQKVCLCSAVNMDDLKRKRPPAIDRGVCWSQSAYVLQSPRRISTKVPTMQVQNNMSVHPNGSLDPPLVGCIAPIIHLDEPVFDLGPAAPINGVMWLQGHEGATNITSTPVRKAVRCHSRLSAERRRKLLSYWIIRERLNDLLAFTSEFVFAHALSREWDYQARNEPIAQVESHC